MSQFSIPIQNPYSLLIVSLHGRFDRRKELARWSRHVAIFLVGLILIFGQAVAKSLDSIPVGASDRVLLEQSLNLSSNGGSSNLFVPQQATVFFDYAVESGKELLLMVITEEQFQAMSAGEKPQGSPLLRVTVSGVGTQSVSLGRGTYVVAFIPGNRQPMRASMRARARYAGSGNVK